VYAIEYTRKAKEEDYPLIPKTMRERIRRVVEERLTVHPEIGKPLRYEYSGFRRLRVGDWRVIYKVDEKKKIVTVTAVDHRKDIYMGNPHARHQMDTREPAGL
jgi:mRNA interferase RelE/StbE